jgi:hypothetical protein
LDQFPVLPGATPPTARLPSPEHPESGSLPAEDSFWPENHQWSFPSGPSSLQDHPETPIPAPELWLWYLPLEDDDLVPQRQNFQREFVPRSEQRLRVDQHHAEKLKHTTKRCPQIPANQLFQVST